eukprot:PLAT13925.1.p1 GENE.PLAT13925.1~~PLAT13925.1.p1  ORF type:complete len:245 (+),score=49.38 PLAT13925.1:2-736(+)
MAAARSRFSFSCTAHGPLSANCVMVADTIARKAVVIDPSGTVDELMPRLRSLLNDGDAKGELEAGCVVAIAITHAHFDCMCGAHALADALEGDVPILLHGDDLKLWSNLPKQVADFLPPEDAHALCPSAPAAPDELLEHGHIIEAGLLRCETLHTPGHTAGHCSFYLPQLSVVVAGDSLRKLSVARTSWIGVPSLEGSSDGEQLLRSIRRQLLRLPSDTFVICGSGESTTIGVEAKLNPFLSPR